MNKIVKNLKKSAEEKTEEKKIVHKYVLSDNTKFIFVNRKKHHFIYVIRYLYEKNN